MQNHNYYDDTGIVIINITIIIIIIIVQTHAGVT